MDAVTATLIASGVALLVGLLGVGVSIYTAQVSRRTALEVQYAAERANALVRVVQLLEASGLAARNRIFNVTRARGPEVDPVTGELGDPYAPERRSPATRNIVDEADIIALVSAYGDWDLSVKLARWVLAMENIDEAFLAAEANYYENSRSARWDDFASQEAEERDARTSLRDHIRDVIKVGRPVAARRRGRRSMFPAQSNRT